MQRSFLGGGKKREWESGGQKGKDFLVACGDYGRWLKLAPCPEVVRGVDNPNNGSTKGIEFRYGSPVLKEVFGKNVPGDQSNWYKNSPMRCVNGDWIPPF